MRYGSLRAVHTDEIRSGNNRFGKRHGVRSSDSVACKDAAELLAASIEEAD